jgi:death on curing protein
MPVPKNRQIRCLTVELIKALHLGLLSDYGGLSGTVREDLLQTAFAKPLQLAAYKKPKPSLFELGAAYGFGFAHLHAFSDGNKRVALAAIDVFLQINHFELSVGEAEAVLIIQDLAAGRLSEVELAAWIKLRAVKFKQQ